MALKWVMVLLYISAVVVSLAGLFFIGTFTGFAIFDQTGAEVIDFFPRGNVDIRYERIDPELVQVLTPRSTHEVIVNYKIGKTFVKNFPREKIRQEFTSGGFVANLSEADIKALSLNEDVESIEPVRYFNIALQDSAPLVNASTAWSRQVKGMNITGASETICVIDTGVNFTNPNLAPRNILGCNVYCTTSTCAVNCAQTDLNGHGTHVAGITGAVGPGIYGIAPASNLIGVKVFTGSSGTGASTTSIVNAINWCSARSISHNVSVISISIASSTLFASYCDSSFTSLRNAVNAAVLRNVSVVAASGNNADPNRIGSPACIRNVTSVAASNKDDTLATSYSNYASTVDLVAPGSGINSTCMNGGYCLQTGTSMSTPMVSGAIALLNNYIHLINQSRTPAQLESTLNKTSIRLPYNGTRSYPRINIDAALLSLDIIAPNVSLITPLEAEFVVGLSVEFKCSAEDWQLKNATFELLSNDQPYFNYSTDLQGTEGLVNVTVYDLPSTKYSWGCTFTDMVGNTYSSPKRILYVGAVSTYLETPMNSSVLNVFPDSFSCRVLTPADAFVEKTNFFIWNSTGEEVYSNFTLNGTDPDVSSRFEVPSLENGDYYWNCLGRSSQGLGGFAEFNNTFSVDIRDPLVTLNFPGDEEVIDLQEMPLMLNYSVNYSALTSCSVLVNQLVVNTTSFSLNPERFYTLSLAVGSYNWSVECIDSYGNIGISDSQTFSVNDNSAGGSSGGGGGGGGGGSSGGSGGSSGGGGGGGSGGSGPSSGSNANTSQSSNGSGSNTSQPTNVTGGVISGRAIDDSSAGTILSWVGWLLLGILVLFFTYRYLRSHSESTLNPFKRQRRVLFPIKSNHGSP